MASYGVVFEKTSHLISLSNLRRQQVSILLCDFFFWGGSESVVSLDKLYRFSWMLITAAQ